MTVKTQLRTLLLTVCPRVSIGFAPVATARPYITFQRIGGNVINPLENSIPNKKIGTFQVNVWADNASDAEALIEAVEVAMRTATVFQARPTAEPADDFDADMIRFCEIQDFTVISDR